MPLRSHISSHKQIKVGMAMGKVRQGPGPLLLGPGFGSGSTGIGAGMEFKVLAQVGFKAGSGFGCS